MDDAAKILEVLERLETKVDRIDARTSPLEASCNTLSADPMSWPCGASRRKSPCEPF
jgi:hypothetical protein